MFPPSAATTSLKGPQSDIGGSLRTLSLMAIQAGSPRDKKRAGCMKDVPSGCPGSSSLHGKKKLVLLGPSPVTSKDP